MIRWLLPTGTHFFFLQDAQQLGLQFQRQFADFVEEDCAAIGGLKQSLLRFQRSGEGSLFVAEQLAFDQRGHQRSAVDRDERTVGKGSAEVHGAGDQFLAGSAFAVDEHWSPRIFQARDHAQHVLNLGGRSDDAVHRGFRVHALAQKLVFFDQADFFRHAPQEQTQFLQRRERLGDVVVGAELHGLDSGFDRAVAGHQRDFGARQKLLYLLQKLQA